MLRKIPGDVFKNHVDRNFDSKRPKFFFRTATFPSATFGPLFAFHCPLFVTKNNNLDGNRHASPNAGTGTTFTGRVIVRARDNRHYSNDVLAAVGLLMETSARPPLSMEMNTVALKLPALLYGRTIRENGSCTARGNFEYTKPPVKRAPA